MKLATHALLAASLLGTGLAATTTAGAAELYIYPAQGQTQEQQSRDEYECYGFAKNNTGFDPMAAPTATAPPPASSGTSAGRGAARGAALAGLAVGVATGSTKDAKSAAAGGAAAGALVGGFRNRQDRQNQSQYQQQQNASYSAERDNYNRAYSACLEGRGYTVR